MFLYICCKSTEVDRRTLLKMPSRTDGSHTVTYQVVDAMKYIGIFRKSRPAWENDWSQQIEHTQVQSGTVPGGWRSKCPIMACSTRCKCHMETS